MIRADPSSRRVLPIVCVCVCVSVCLSVCMSICNSNPTHLQRVRRKEVRIRKKEIMNELTLWLWSWIFTVSHTICVQCEFF